MVNEQGLVKVLDFGLAKLTQSITTASDEATRTMQPSTEEGKILGTIAYMSPEQAEVKKVDARSDIFSFGSVLYEVVTGEQAFRGGVVSISQMMAEAGALDPMHETFPEYERVVDPKYL